MELSPPICRVAAARAGPTGITEQISDPALKIPSIWDHSQYSHFQTLQIPQFAGAKDKIFSTNFYLWICEKKLNRMFKELFLMHPNFDSPLGTQLLFNLWAQYVAKTSRYTRHHNAILTN